MNKSNKSLIIKLSTTLLLVGTLAGIWLFSNSFLNRQVEGVDVIQTVVCDFQQGSCQATRGKQQIILAIDAESITSFTPLDFRVQLAGFEADEVSIDFQGVDMFMGINQLSLTEQSNGHYTGTKTLPGHANEAMVWRAKVFVRQGEQMTAGWFDFEAK
ncbi:MAG: hypothetical protein V7731_04565 [Amphritea sp.]